MPTLLREGGYAFRFRSTDGHEPPHVHVDGNGGAAKFWLADLRLASSTGYNRYQLGQITRIVAANAAGFLEEWHEFFG